MGTPGKVVVRDSGKRGLRTSGNASVRDFLGECPECCVPCVCVQGFIAPHGPPGMPPGFVNGRMEIADNQSLLDGSCIDQNTYDERITSLGNNTYGLSGLIGSAWPIYGLTIGNPEIGITTRCCFWVIVYGSPSYQPMDQFGSFINTIYAKGCFDDDGKPVGLPDTINYNYDAVAACFVGGPGFLIVIGCLDETGENILYPSVLGGIQSTPRPVC